MQQIYLGADHAGFALKRKIIEYLKNKQYELYDLGTDSDQSVDYPDFAKKLVDKVSTGPEKLGILICGSGIGMSIAANRNSKIRAALCHNTEYAKLAREHNDANVLVLGARFLDDNTTLEIINTFLETKFLQERHSQRVKKLSDL